MLISIMNLTTTHCLHLSHQNVFRWKFEKKAIRNHVDVAYKRDIASIAEPVAATARFIVSLILDASVSFSLNTFLRPETEQLRLLK